MPGRILVCDDEPYIQHAVRMKLAKSGYEVEVAADGQAGLEAIQREMPALLITDLQMPRMDGLELCRVLRTNPETHNLPIIMLTAKGFEIDSSGVAKILRLSEVMFKPFSPRELLQSAEKAIAEGPPAASGSPEDLAAAIADLQGSSTAGA
jgi:two-component system, OmpR family, alkaline phosphatase synthesis response regulator PhoP